MTAAEPDAARTATRVRILEATLRCVEQWGLAKTTIEDVASAADLSRATVYRYFPGGRDEVIAETVRLEVGNFLQRIEIAIVDDSSIAAKLEHALKIGHRGIHEHRLLQQMLSTEREAMLAQLAETGPLMAEIIAGEFASALATETLAPGVEILSAAEYLTRLYLSYLGSPGRVDLTDAAQVARLVRTQFLGGILRVHAAPTGGSAAGSGARGDHEE